MLGFLIYEGKVAVALAVFYMFYRLLLKKETFHRFNRAVLVGTAMLSFLLPLCVITIRRPMEMVPAGFVEALDAAAMPAMEPAAVTAVRAPASAPWWPTALTLLFFAGVALVLLRLAVSILSIRRIIRQGTCVGEEDGCRIIVTEWDIDPFSWMRYIVLSRKDWEGPHDAILTHEKAHITYGHSADLLLVSILSAFQWFNPAIWMLRADLQELHEYEADDAVLRSGANIKDYQYLLIRKAVGKSGYSVANSFNHSILKNRITMMSKSKSSLARGLRALYLLPLVCLGLGLQAQTIYVPADKDSEKNLPDEKKKSLLEEIVVVTYAADSVTSDQIRHAEDSERDNMTVPGNPDVDTLPVFGEESFSMWLNRRIAYPRGCLFEGNVVVGFTVNEEGNVEDVHVLRSLCEELDDLIVNLVKQSPAWTPAIRNGEPVPYRMAIPVTFMIRLSKTAGVSAQPEAITLTIKADGSILAEKGIVPLEEVAAYLDGLGVSESSYRMKVHIYAASDVKMGFIDDLKDALRPVKGVKLFYSLQGG
jgi:TonB family protein